MFFIIAGSLVGLFLPLSMYIYWDYRIHRAYEECKDQLKHNNVSLQNDLMMWRKTAKRALHNDGYASGLVNLLFAATFSSSLRRLFLMGTCQHCEQEFSTNNLIKGFQFDLNSKDRVAVFTCASCYEAVKEASEPLIPVIKSNLEASQNAWNN